MTTVMGVDAAAGEWLTVLVVDGAYVGAESRPRMADLVARYPDVVVIAVDIPIVLPAPGFRRPADDEARRFVGRERAASVFQTFPREVLVAAPYAAAAAEARRLLSAGLSQQSYALRDRIFEVEAVARTDRRVVEIHPEVSYRALNDEPLRLLQAHVERGE